MASLPLLDCQHGISYHTIQTTFSFLCSSFLSLKLQSAKQGLLEIHVPVLDLADLHTIKIYLQEFLVETSQTGVQCDCFINQLIIGTMHVCAIYGSDGLMYIITY